MGISVRRMAWTEYVQLLDPEYTRSTPYGRFVNHPDYPGRYDANQLLDCKCGEDEVEDLLSTLEHLYEPTGLAFRKISGHDPTTFAHLAPTLAERGWNVKRTNMMVFEEPPTRPMNPAVRVEERAAPCAELWRRIYSDFRESRFGFYWEQNERLEGVFLVAWLGDEPVGTTGWFVVDRVARYRGVHTHESARRS